MNITAQELPATTSGNQLEMTSPNSSNTIDYLYNYLLIAQQNKDSIAIFNAIEKISIRSSILKNTDRAEELAREALKIAFELQVDSLIASALNAQAIALRAEADLKFDNQLIDADQFLQMADSVIELYNQKFVYLENEDLPLYEMYTYQGIGQMYFRTAKIRFSDLDKAIDNFEKAHKTAVKTNDKKLIFSITLWIARTYNFKEDFSKGISTLQELEPLLENKEIGIQSKQQFYGAFLSAYLNHVNRRDLVLYFEQYKSLSNKRWMIEQQDQIAAMDRQYETTKTKNELSQQEEINLLQQAQITQRNTIIGIIVLLFTGSGFGFIYVIRLNLKNKKLAKRNELLVKEQNHRVKNNLQMISSLLSIQANRSDGESRKQMLEGSRRVQAIALLHRKLYDDLEGVKEVNIKEFAKDLIEDLLFASGKQHIPVNLTMKDISLPVEKSVHLALVLNELITNSIKHVFSKPILNGECIELSVTKKSKKYMLAYRDHGGEFNANEFRNSDSLGSKIITSQSDYLSKVWSISDKDGLYYSIELS